jgi:hypothetical protein
MEPVKRKAAGGAWDGLPNEIVSLIVVVDVSYAAPQVHEIVNVALH